MFLVAAFWFFTRGLAWRLDGICLGMGIGLLPAQWEQVEMPAWRDEYWSGRTRSLQHVEITAIYIYVCVLVNRLSNLSASSTLVGGQCY